MSRHPDHHPGNKPPVDASMTLITSMLRRPLDPGYQAAADKRTAEGRSPATGWRAPWLLVFLLITGIVIGISAAALRSRESTRADARAEIIRQIESQQDLVDERSETVRDLQGQIDRATGRLNPGAPGAQRLQDLRATNGLVAVSGPGVRLTLDDAPGSGTSADGDPRSSASNEGRVLSRDLQIITNGLWASGAEGVAINGQRLTSRSAIRFAGDAILVNFRPLNRPYTIDAIGEAESLRTAFVQSSAGAYFDGLRQNYRIPTSLTTQQELTLPSAVASTTRYAKVVPDGRAAPATKRSPTKESTP